MIRKVFLVIPTILLILVLSTVATTSQGSEQPTLSTVQGLVVVDADGKKLGEVVGIARGNDRGTTPGLDGPVVAFSVNGHVFTVVVFEDHFFGNGRWDSVSFDSPDCTGTPFIRETGSALPSVVVNTPGNTVYIEDPDATVQTVTVRSSLREMHHGGGCITGDREDDLIRAIPLIDLDTVFTPPFTVRPLKTSYLPLILSRFINPR